MLLGKVIGKAVAPVKDPKLVGVKLLIVELLNKSLKAIGPPKVAADANLKAGTGDYVILVRSKDASLALENPGAPVDLAIVGLVDTIHIDEEGLSYTLKTGYTKLSH
ncbi:MAG: EutN/CcmL family microcompartment protein [Chloroflexota bacterium]